MRIIALDASGWSSFDDFYNAIFSAIGAPKGHGKNVDALDDSMIWGGINALEPPYKLRISGTDKTPKPVRDEIELAKRAIERGRANYRAQHGLDVEVELETYP